MPIYSHIQEDLATDNMNPHVSFMPIYSHIQEDLATDDDSDDTLLQNATWLKEVQAETRFQQAVELLTHMKV